MDATSTDQPLSLRRASIAAKAFDRGVWLVSISLWAFAATCYWLRFDACSYVTLFPTWSWAAVGMAFAWPLVARKHWQAAATLAALWFGFLLTFADTPSSLVRRCLPAPARGTNLRVISLNSAGQGSGAELVKRYQPDIVLFQESPRLDSLVALATEMFGSRFNLVHGVDASILARGHVDSIAIPLEFRGNFVHARVQINEETLNVISLRLFPCPIRLDFWSADCWRLYAANRELRRRQLSQIARYIATLSADEPLIVGGDFNCPPWDPSLDLLKPRLTDAFTVAGRGWGATIIELAGWPLIRIDQIWTNDRLRAVDVIAAAAAASDHHMVVADFALEKSAN